MSFGLVQDTVAAITTLSLSVVKAGREFISCSYGNRLTQHGSFRPWLSQTTDSNMSPLLDLPVEVLARILSYLDVKDILSMSRVCKRFYEASYIESIWMHQCCKDYKVPMVPNCGISYRDLYTKVLHQYGHLIGVWQRKIGSYGGLLQVYYTNGKLIGVEYLPPTDPNLKDPLRRRFCFCIQLDATNKLQTQCIGGHYGGHRAEIGWKGDTGMLRFKCCATENHEHPEGRSKGLMQWLEDECGTPLDLHTYTHNQELLLMKFLVLCQYNYDYTYRKLTMPKKCANVPIQPGFFKGTYGAHGLEIILLQYVNNENVIKAVAEKVSGDPNVPAGEVTFHVSLQNGIVLTREQQESISTLEEAGLNHVPFSSGNLAQPFRLPTDCLERFHDIPRICSSRFSGHGQIAGHGFANPSYCVGHWIIFNEDMFGFLWLDLLSLSMFHRVQEDLTS